MPWAYDLRLPKPKLLKREFIELIRIKREGYEGMKDDRERKQDKREKSGWDRARLISCKNAGGGLEKAFTGPPRLVLSASQPRGRATHRQAE